MKPFVVNNAFRADGDARIVYNSCGLFKHIPYETFLIAPYISLTISPFSLGSFQFVWRYLNGLVVKATDDRYIDTHPPVYKPTYMGSFNDEIWTALSFDEKLEVWALLTAFDVPKAGSIFTWWWYSLLNFTIPPLYTRKDILLEALEKSQPIVMASESEKPIISAICRNMFLLFSPSERKDILPSITSKLAPIYQLSLRKQGESPNLMVGGLLSGDIKIDWMRNTFYSERFYRSTPELAEIVALGNIKRLKMYSSFYSPHIIRLLELDDKMWIWEKEKKEIRSYSGVDDDIAFYTSDLSRPFKPSLHIKDIFVSRNSNIRNYDIDTIWTRKTGRQFNVGGLILYGNTEVMRKRSPFIEAYLSSSDSGSDPIVLYSVKEGSLEDDAWKRFAMLLVWEYLNGISSNQSYFEHLHGTLWEYIRYFSLDPQSSFFQQYIGQIYRKGDTVIGILRSIHPETLKLMDVLHSADPFDLSSFDRVIISRKQLKQEYIFSYPYGAVYKQYKLVDPTVAVIGDVIIWESEPNLYEVQMIEKISTVRGETIIEGLSRIGDIGYENGKFTSYSGKEMQVLILRRIFPTS